MNTNELVVFIALLASGVLLEITHHPDVASVTFLGALLMFLS